MIENALQPIYNYISVLIDRYMYIIFFASEVHAKVIIEIMGFNNYNYSSTFSKEKYFTKKFTSLTKKKYCLFVAGMNGGTPYVLVSMITPKCTASL